MNDDAQLHEEIEQSTKSCFTDPRGISGAELNIGGDDMEIGGLLLDNFDLDPEAYLRNNVVSFTAPVRVDVLLDEDNHIYYRLTFLED